MRSQGQSRLALPLPDRSWGAMSGHSDLGRRTARFDPLRSFALTSPGARTGHSSIAYSITSLAWSRSDGAMVMPSVLAVFKLITSSNLFGFWTGKSAGLAPFRRFSRSATILKRHYSGLINTAMCSSTKRHTTVFASSGNGCSPPARQLQADRSPEREPPRRGSRRLISDRARMSLSTRRVPPT